MTIFTLDDIFATNPPPGVAVIEPTPSEIATGLLGGTATRPFFNAVLKKHSEGILTAQQLAMEQNFATLEASAGLDQELLYSDDYAGTLNTDVRNKTPIFGPNLRNDGGLIPAEYRIGPSSQVFKQSDLDIPIYTECGQNSSLLYIEASVFTDFNRFSTVGDKVGICFNCIGAFQRAEIRLSLNASQQLILSYGEFDTNNVESGQQSWPVASSDSLFGTSYRFIAGDLRQNGFLCVSIPEINFFIETPQSVVVPSLSTSHGFVLSPKSFFINSLLIKTL